MKVEFLNEKSEVLLTVTINEGGTAVWDAGDVSEPMTLDGEVIFEVNTGVRVYPRQGDRFMRALPDNYRTAYLHAVLKEED